MKVSGEAAAFRLISPSGRVATIRKGVFTSAIADCYAYQFSNEEIGDPDEAVPESVLLARKYTGGWFELDDPPAGIWQLEAIATSACRDSCPATVSLGATDASADTFRELRVTLRPRKRVRFRIPMKEGWDPPSDWADLALDPSARDSGFGGRARER